MKWNKSQDLQKIVRDMEAWLDALFLAAAIENLKRAEKQFENQSADPHEEISDS